MWDVAQINEEESRLRKQLQLLQDEQKRLRDLLHVPGAEDQDIAGELAEVVEMMKDLEQEIKEKYGVQGGRRKRNRRTKRRSKSRAKKSRRSKH